MLKLEFSSKNIAIRFEHGRFNKETLLDAIDVNHLACEVLDYIDDQDVSWIRQCTIAGVFVDDEIVGYGLAICHPIDTFSKSLGRKIALRDALWVSDLDKPCRTAIWKKYLAECTKKHPVIVALEEVQINNGCKALVDKATDVLVCRTNNVNWDENDLQITIVPKSEENCVCDRK